MFDDVKKYFEKVGNENCGGWRSLLPFRDSRIMSERGAFILKRKVLGFFGQSRIKSLDELSKILTEIKMFCSENEAKTFIPQLYGKKLEYEGWCSTDDGPYLIFNRTCLQDGREACRIERYVRITEDDLY